MSDTRNEDKWVITFAIVAAVFLSVLLFKGLYNLRLANAAIGTKAPNYDIERNAWYAQCDQAFTHKQCQIIVGWYHAEEMPE